jgi:ABC-2 type transport system permease protein
VPQIAGWTLNEALLVTGFFLLYNAFVVGLVEPNLGAVVDGVRSGSLDYMLIRPVDAQLLLSCQRIDPNAIWELLAGGTVVGVASWRLGVSDPVAMAAAGVLLAAGIVATYALWLMVICLSFWFVRVDNLRYLLVAVTDAGRWPVTVYSGWLRVALTTVIPVALVSSYPAMALSGRMDGATAASAVVTALVLVMLSRLVLLRALARYSSASS